MSLTIAIRADASPRIGSGHVMRCLTLAGQLSAMGFECVFVCRAFDGHYEKRIIDAGHQVRLLPVDSGFDAENWLGADQKTDLSQTTDVLKEVDPDWIVVDHYLIDAEWERGFKDTFANSKTLVIDDLANRTHDCELLVDLSPGRNVADYRDWVGPDTKLLLGLDFALLRAEFVEKRKSVGSPKLSFAKPPHLLVNFGGGNTADFFRSSAVALSQLEREGMEFTATIIGAPQSLAAEFPNHVHHLASSNEMASEIGASDLMICGAGGTNWERYSLGVPAVVMVIADNQRFNSAAIERDGGGLCVENNSDDIALAIGKLLSDENAYGQMSQRCWELCDGFGARRIARQMVAASVEIMDCTQNDARFVYDARYGGNAEQFYKNPTKPGFEDHVGWFEHALKSSSYHLLVAKLGGNPIAHVRLDPNESNKNRVEIGIAVHEDARGQGLGVPILVAACRYCKSLGFDLVDAEIHRDNLASIKAFEQAGFQHVGQVDDVLIHLICELVD